MATCSSLLNRLQMNGLPPFLSLSRQGHHSIFVDGSFNWPNKRKQLQDSAAIRCSPSSYLKIASVQSLHVSPSDSGDELIRQCNLCIEQSKVVSKGVQRLTLADLDPATAKLAIGILGPFLSAFSFLFILRIIMSWYPKLPVGKFPYVIAYAPTEPILIQTRKLIPPLGGVDVTPVVWFGLISFLNEILVGPQGLLVLLSQQV